MQAGMLKVISFEYLMKLPYFFVSYMCKNLVQKGANEVIVVLLWLAN